MIGHKEGMIGHQEGMIGHKEGMTGHKTSDSKSFLHAFIGHPQRP